MSPRKFLDGDNKQRTKSGVVINGPRPTPLKLRQESHTIQKHRPPIIIYMNSPEVIHTKPNDFMALVQKLTGHHSASKVQNQDQDQDQRHKKTLKQEDDENENSDKNIVTSKKDKIMKAKSPMFSMPSNPNYMKDIPLYTPNSNNDYFYSPQQRLFRYSDGVSSSSPNLSISLSPGSIVEILKGLPEY